MKAKKKKIVSDKKLLTQARLTLKVIYMLALFKDGLCLKPAHVAALCKKGLKLSDDNPR